MSDLKKLTRVRNDRASEGRIHAALGGVQNIEKRRQFFRSIANQASERMSQAAHFAAKDAVTVDHVGDGIVADPPLDANNNVRIRIGNGPVRTYHPRVVRRKNPGQ